MGTQRAQPGHVPPGHAAQCDDGHRAAAGDQPEPHGPERDGAGMASGWEDRREEDQLRAGSGGAHDRVPPVHRRRQHRMARDPVPGPRCCPPAQVKTMGRVPVRSAQDDDGATPRDRADTRQDRTPFGHVGGMMPEHDPRPAWQAGNGAPQRIAGVPPAQAFIGHEPQAGQAWQTHPPPASATGVKVATAPPAPSFDGPPQARLPQLLAAVAQAAAAGGHPPPTIIAIAKTHGAEAIAPLIRAGHRHFGENRVQEAAAKWPGLRALADDLSLHLVGRLQSNKAAEAVRLFDAIHALDRPSLVDALGAAVRASGRHPLLFAQVNIGEEPQKGGVAMADLDALLARSRDAGLTVSGLMAIPPVERDPAPYFALLAKMGRERGLAHLSMGMTADYDIAATLGATHVRIGTGLFGDRGR